MKHLRHLLALALAAALTLMLLLPTYAAVIDGVYTDYMTGLKFTIPADWEEYAAPSTMPSYIKETFAYQKDGAFSMMGYGSVDLWMAALSNGQVSGTREELDNSAFTAEDIASLFGASSDIISTAAYGGVEYYTARITSPDAVWLVVRFAVVSVELEGTGGSDVSVSAEGYRTLESRDSKSR